MISVTFVKNYCEAVYGSKAVYVLGANCELLTRELYDRLVKILGKAAFQDIVIERDEGKLASDCSGFAYPLSGADKTADGYYRACKIKGRIEEMPEDKVLLVFRESKDKSGMEHMGIYTSDNTTYEMNHGCEKKALDKKKWTHYGIPEWIAQETGEGVTAAAAGTNSANANATGATPANAAAAGTNTANASATGATPANANSAGTAPTESAKFYPRYTGASGSLVDALFSVGEKDASFSRRKKLAAANGIKLYLGTAAQNTKLLHLLKAGKLIKIS